MNFRGDAAMYGANPEVTKVFFGIVPFMSIWIENC